MIASSHLTHAGNQTEVGSESEPAAKSAICLDLASIPYEASAVIYEKNADSVLAPASITKLLTVITAIEVFRSSSLPENFTLEVCEDDDVNGSGRNVYSGDRLSFADSIANLLLPSSNVLANTIARTFGEILLIQKNPPRPPPSAAQRFIFEMNRIAKRLGMINSQFMNPHGLATRGHKSTARDLLLLTKACLGYEQIANAWGLESCTINIDGPKPRALKVNPAFQSSIKKEIPNFFLPYYLGGKTGSLYPSFFNLAAVSWRPAGRQRVSVILGSPTVSDRYFDYLKLATYEIDKLG
jgi:D-alanyl-D-alanine carboxypeptidase